MNRHKDQLLMNLVGKLCAAHEEIGRAKERKYNNESKDTKIAVQYDTIRDMRKVIKGLEDINEQA